ncbi:MAG: hypothetical protein ICV62_12015 [Cyanobacteria bacterium Co-bin13]|nr:hypothetical protein [Cyanobacteria bacterium Co-bin13]
MATLRIPYSASAPTASAAAPPPTPSRKLPHHWGYGRGYAVIALLAPLVLGSLVLLHLQTAGQKWLRIVLAALRESNPASKQPNSLPK